MSMRKISYADYWFPPEIIQQAIWLYLQFTLSFRDVEDLLAKRGTVVSYQTVRRSVNHFGRVVEADVRKRRPMPHSIWHLDKVYLKVGAGWSMSGAPPRCLRGETCSCNLRRPEAAIHRRTSSRLRIGRRRAPEVPVGNRHDPSERKLTEDTHENTPTHAPGGESIWL
jgi:hypothetical protein